MEFLSLTITGEAQALVPADKAVATVRVVTTADDRTIAKQKAQRVGKALEQYISNFPAAAEKLVEDDTDSAAKALDPNVTPDHEPTGDCEYELVSADVLAGHLAVGAKTSPSNRVVDDTVTQRPDSVPSSILQYTRSRVSAYRAPPRHIDYAFPPYLDGLTVQDQAESDDQKANPTGAPRKAAQYEADAYFYVSLDTEHQLTDFKKGIATLSKSCRITDVQCSQSPEKQMHTDSVLRRDAMKHALAQVRDYCHGMSCDPASTKIAPTSVKATLSPTADGTAQLPFDPYNPSACRHTWTTGNLMYTSYRPHTPSSNTFHEFQRTLHLDVGFEIRTNEIRLTEDRDEKHRQYKKKGTIKRTLGAFSTADEVAALE